jgi:hypothetical protein
MVAHAAVKTSNPCFLKLVKIKSEVIPELYPVCNKRQKEDVEGKLPVFLLLVLY